MLHVRCCAWGKGKKPYSRPAPPHFAFIAQAQEDRVSRKGGSNMIWTICVVLLILWLFGITTAYTLGGFIHILLLLAIAAVLIRIIQGRRIA